MIRAAIYARVSTDQQAQEGDSISAQLDALQKYVSDRQDMVLAGTYVDDGISGRKIDRDELQRLLDDVKADKVDVILFTKLDRWFRSVRHYATTQDLLDQHKVTWTAIWEPIYDTTTPTGRLIVNQMMSFAQFEAENTSQRIRQVMKYKIEKGEAVTGRTPYGYRIENKHLVIVPEEAEKVLAIFKHYNEGGSLNDAVRYASSIGLQRSKHGLICMLKLSKYKGHHRGNDHYCPPIVPEPLWDDVNRKIGMNIKTNVKYDYILIGLVKCGCCNKRMRALNRTGTKQRRKAYRCPRFYSGAVPRTCTNKKNINESQLEKYLLDNVTEWAKDYVLEYTAEQASAKDNSAKITVLQKKKTRLTDLYINELITMDDFKREKEIIENSIAKLETEQTPEAKDMSAFKQLLEIKDLRALYNTMDPADKRFLWRSIIKEISYDGESIKVTFL